MRFFMEILNLNQISVKLSAILVLFLFKIIPTKIFASHKEPSIHKAKYSSVASQGSLKASSKLYVLAFSLCLSSEVLR